MHTTEEIIIKKSIFRKKAPLLFFIPIIPVILFFLLFLESTIKKRIEHHASVLNGAPVAIGSFRLSLLKGTLTIKQIEFGNLANPSKNILEVDSIEGKFQITPLWRKKIIFDEIKVSGIHYLTNRNADWPEEYVLNEELQSPRLFDRLATNIGTSLNFDVEKNPLKYLAQFSTGLQTHALLEEMGSELKTIRNTTEAEKRLSLLETEIDRLVETLPEPGILAGLKQKLKNTPEPNRGIASLNSAEKTRADIAKRFQSLVTSHQQLDKEVREIRGLVNNLESFFEEDNKIIGKRLGLPSTEVTELTPVLFGPRINLFLEHISYWVDLSRRRMPTHFALKGGAYTATPVGTGLSIAFPYMAGNPGFLVKQIFIESTADSKDGTGVISATIEGITDDPYIYGHPLIGKVKLSFPDREISDFEMDFEVDHVGEIPKERFALKAASFPINDTVLSDSSDLKISSKKGHVRIESHGDFEGEKVNLNWAINSEGVEFKVDSRYKQVQDFVSQLLTKLYDFDISGNITGTTDKLILTTTSGIGKTLAEGFSDEFRKQLKAIDETVLANLRDLCNPKRVAILERLDKLEHKQLSTISQMSRQVKELTVGLK